MHLPNHLALGWLVGHRQQVRRDRLLIAWAGVAPDVDALTLFLGQDTYGRWHHVLCHGLVFATLVTLGCWVLSQRNMRVAALAFLSFHLHLVADLLGSGVEWSISYLYPFSPLELAFPWGWELASWQNVTIMLLLLGVMVVTARRVHRTFAEAFLPANIDREVADTLTRWTSWPRRPA